MENFTLFFKRTFLSYFSNPRFLEVFDKRLLFLLLFLYAGSSFGQLLPCPNNNDDEPPFTVAQAYDPNYNATLEIATAVVGPGDDFCIGNDPGKDTEGGTGSFLFTGLQGGQDACAVEFCFSPRQGCGNALGNTCIWVEDPDNPGQWKNLGEFDKDNFSELCVLAPPGVTEFAIAISRPGQGPVSVNDIIVNQPPTIDIGADQTACETDLPQNIDLTSFEPGAQTGGVWSVSGTPIADPSTYILNGVLGDMLTFEYTFDASSDVGYTCLISDELKYTITDDCFVCPSLTNETGDFATCVDDQGQLLSVQTDVANIDIEFVYFASAQANPYNGGTPIGMAVTPVAGTATSSIGISGLSPGTYHAYAILDTNDTDLTDPDCQPFTEIVITIDDLPVIDIADQMVCTSVTSVDLTALEPAAQAGGTWSNAGGDIADATDVDPTTGAFTYTYSDGNGCEGTALVAYTFDDLPVIDIADQMVCTSVTSVDLTALEPAAQAGGTWSNAGGDIADATDVDPTTGAFTYTYSDGNGCEGSGIVAYTFDDLPVIDIADQMVCTSVTSVDLTALEPAAQAGGTWSNAGGDIADATDVDPTTGAFTYTYSDGNGCEGTALVAYTFDDLPVIDIADQMVCTSVTSVDLTALEPAAQAGGTWSNAGGAIADATDVDPTTGAFTYTYSDGNGCEGTALVAYTFDDLPLIDIADQMVCSSVTSVDLTALEPAAQAGGTWSNAGGDIADATDVDPNTGAFTYTYSDGNGCEGTAFVAYTFDDLPVIDIADQIACETTVGLDISDLEPVGQTGGVWSNVVGIIADPTSVDPHDGPFTYTYTNVDGCEGSDEVAYTFKPKPDAGDDNSIAVCDGTIVDLSTLTTVAGGVFDDLDGTGQLSGSLFNSAGLAPGSYEFLYDLEDPDDLCKSDFAIITVIVEELANAGNDNEIKICAGTTVTEMALVTALGPDAQTGGTWSPAFAGAGIYTYTIAASGSCPEASAEVVVDELDAPEPIIIGDTTYCYEGNGVVLDAGAGYASYLWSPGGETTQTITVTTGVYTVTVSTDQGCAGTSDAIAINSYQMLSCSITQDELASNFQAADGVATVNPMGGSENYTYQWDNGETTQTATALTFGTHTVTVVDSECGETTCEIFISKQLICGINLVSEASCSSADGAATVTAYGGYPNYTYLWDNGETTAQALALSSGMHTVTVRDSAGAATTCSIEIPGSTSANLSCSIDQDQLASNYLADDGVATVTATGGSGGYTYLWDNGETTQTASNLTYGIHSVKAIDNNGCGETTCEIFVRKQLICGVNLESPISANGSSDGRATVTTYGGYSGYTYLWDNGETTKTAIALNYGTHTVTVTDTVGATTECAVMVPAPNDLSCSITQNQLAANYLADDGVATVTPMGGSGGFTYMWDNGETTATASMLTYGIHSVTVNDSSGYETVCEIFVNKKLVCTTSLTAPATCAGGGDGVALVTVYGGYTPYTYSWNGGPFTDSASNSGLGVGNHTVTVMDSSGALTQCTIFVTGTSELSCGIAQDVLASNYLAEDGVATVNGFGGSGSYTYLWDNGETTQTATALTYGPHSVMVTDSSGCGYTSCEIYINKNLVCSVGQDLPASCSGGEDGAATVMGYGGYTPYRYSWDGGDFTDNKSHYNLGVGIHTVIIKDATGATSECTVTISGPNQLSANISVTSKVSTVGGNAGAATAIALGGRAPYTFVWNNGATTETVIGLPAGKYSVTITDTNGCWTSLDVTIDEPDTEATILTEETIVMDTSGNIEDVVTIEPDEDSIAGEKPELSRNKTEVTAYPLAFVNQLNINVKIEYDARMSVQIFDKNGRLVMSDYSRSVTKGANDMRFNLNRLGPDVYILVLDTGRERIVKKILSRE